MTYSQRSRALSVLPPSSSLHFAPWTLLSSRAEYLAGPDTRCAYDHHARHERQFPHSVHLSAFERDEISPLSLIVENQNENGGRWVEREGPIGGRNDRPPPRFFSRLSKRPFFRPLRAASAPGDLARERPYSARPEIWKAGKRQDVGEARRSAATAARIASSLPYAGGLHFFFHVRSIVTGRLVAWADGRPGRG